MNSSRNLSRKSCLSVRGLRRTLGHQDRPDKFRSKDKSFGGGRLPLWTYFTKLFFMKLFLRALTNENRVKLPLFHTLHHSCRHRNNISQYTITEKMVARTISQNALLMLPQIDEDNTGSSNDEKCKHDKQIDLLSYVHFLKDSHSLSLKIFDRSALLEKCIAIFFVMLDWNRRTRI